MENCKHCGSEKLRKNGFNRGNNVIFVKTAGRRRQTRKIF
jgi:hypothetical protein